MRKSIQSAKSLHIIFALKTGGGENLIINFLENGDEVISLTSNSILEKYQLKKIPFRIKSKQNYYGIFEYLLSVPSLFFLFLHLNTLKRNYKLVFHGFPFQFCGFLFRYISHKRKITIVYHQYKKAPKTLIGHISILLERFFLNISPKIKLVGVSPWVADFVKLYFSKSKKVFLLNIPLNLKINNEFSLKHQNYREFLIYGARLVETKGQMRFLAEIEKMNITSPKIKNIIFCGSGPLKNKIRNFSELSLKQFNIIILENLDREDYLALVKRSSGFIFPSFREAFPLSLLEGIFLSKNIFIWEEYLYNFFKECSYSNKYLKEFIEKGKLKPLNNKNKRIDELKEIHLKSNNFIYSLK